MNCTIIVPCYNEKGSIEPLFAALVDVIGTDPSFSILFVDDGSTDGTIDRIKSLAATDERVNYLRLMTNYGHQKALMAGLQACRTELALTMDADLQHPPRYIHQLLQVREETKAEVVVARRSGDQIGWAKNSLSRWFYPLFATITGVQIIPGGSDFRLYSRKALDVLASVHESEPFLRGMIPDLRFPTATIEYELGTRVAERPSYTFKKSARMGFLALLRFSKLPYRAGFALGLLGVAVSTLQGLHYLYLRFFTDSLVPGQADLIVFLSLVSSITIILLALLLRMATQILEMLRNEPTFVVAEGSRDGHLSVNPNSPVREAAPPIRDRSVPDHQ
ncbi:MAG: glycosyltransferase family 2 protein [Thermoanaerobaculia bacterium]|nr:glycosyltransferase family 2 protein [Thermoanaerobaculia bacterium]